jgi:predicted nucleotidyltransferase
VAEVLPLSESEVLLLESLLRHKTRFLVVGLSAAALQGAPVVTEDVDLWFEDLGDPKLTQALREVGARYVPPLGHNPPMLAGAGSEPFDLVLRMDGLDKFPGEWRRAIKIKVGRLELKVLPLERILASKQAANRPKDQRVIPVLQNVLRTMKRKTIRRARKASAKRRPE